MLEITLLIILISKVMVCQKVLLRTPSQVEKSRH